MCFWILEFAMVVMGLFAMVKGEIMLTRKRIVRGGTARLDGALIAAPVPLGIAWMVFVVAVDAATPWQAYEYWVEVGVGGMVALHAICLLSAVTIAIVKHDRPGVVPATPVYEGMAPAQQFPPPDPNNPYSSPYGGQLPRLPPRQ